MSSGCLQMLKTINGKSLTVGPKKWLWSDRKWSFTRGFNCKSLNVKILVFCIGGHLWEVVAYNSEVVTH